MLHAIFLVQLLLVYSGLVRSAAVVRYHDSEFPYRLPWFKLSSALEGNQVSPRDTCTLGTKLSHPVALAICQAAGIGIWSATGKIGCRDPGCTSLEQVRCDTVLGILAFQRASGCAGIVITGGTEMGHDPGQYSHYNGYKLDIALTECATDYVLEAFRTGGVRPDGAKFYIDGRGNEYAMESDHWDILYY